MPIVFVIVLLAVAICGYFGVNKYKSYVYQQKLNSIIYIIIDSGAEAEECGNLIHSVWYNTIFYVSNTDTDKYTKTNGCFNDDFNELASLMAESDVIIFCTPLYWYSFPTQIKAAIDKFYSFIIGKKDVPIKECMLLSCGELEDPHVFDGIVRSFELIAQDRGWKNRGHYLVNSVNEKGAISNTEHLQKIYDIGKKF